MSITTYVGVPGIAVDVEDEQELYEVLDTLHTQVMDNMDEDPKVLALLSDTMYALSEIMESRGIDLPI